MGTVCRLFIFVLLSVNVHAMPGNEDAEEQGNCHELCTNGCYGTDQDQCCHEQCHGGCTNASDTGCKECRNVKLNGRCQGWCGPAFVYNPETFNLEPNPDFQFRHGHECVARCPKFVFTEGSSCVERCSEGYRPEGDQCVSCGGACPQKGENNPLVNDQCDGVKTYQWGVISRKNRPTGNVTCTQVLIGPAGSTLRIRLREVTIQSSLDEKLVLSSDGYRQSFDRETFTTTLRLKADALIVQHRTVVSGNGYTLEYNFVAPENELAHSDCDRILTSNTGRFQSPGFPNKYRARERCAYHIIVDPGYHVNVVFSRLYLQGDEPACLADKIEVSEPVLGTTTTYCGRHRPPFIITSKTNCLVLKFTSDSFNNFKGYSATYTAVKDIEAGEDFSVDPQGDLPPPF